MFSLIVEEKEEEAEEEEEKEEAEEEEEEEEEVVCASPARPADRRLSQPSVSGEGPAGRAPPAPPRKEGGGGAGAGEHRAGLAAGAQVISGDEAPTGGQPHLPPQPRSIAVLIQIVSGIIHQHTFW